MAQEITKGTHDFHWASRVVFVTGCTSALGIWLCRTLSDSGAEVIGLIRHEIPQASPFRLLGLLERTRLVRGEVKDFTTLAAVMQKYEIDTVVHLAALTSGLEKLEPRTLFDVNITGTWNVLEAARLSPRPIRMIFASSTAVYGPGGTQLWTEDMPTAGNHPYSASKICGEILCRSFHYSYGLAVSILRFCNLYGGGEPKLRRLIPGTILSVLHDESPIIRGDGTGVQGFLYIDDAVQACLAGIEKMKTPHVTGEAFNISAEEGVSVLSVVKTILRLMDREDLEPRILREGVHDLAPRCASSRKAKRHLGWSAQTPLETGLRQTIDWHRNFAQTGHY